MKRVFCNKLVLLSGTALGMCAAPLVSHALPQGGVVSGGAAEIRDAGAHTVITQNTDRTVIDWNSFDIGAGEQVHFAQPSANAAILNRIHDGDASRIDGTLTANGQVYLVNPNGMVFGSGAQVDVGSLVATTADTSNADFMKGGAVDFNKPGNPDAQIINHGSITVKEGGLAALVAPSVENDGIITAKAGTVTLAAGDTMTLDFYGDDLLSVAVSDKVKSQSVSNSGTLVGKDVLLTTADAASVIDSVINMDGIVDAASATDVGGTIVFAGQDAEITVGQNAMLTATGATGGGTVHIGGEYQGKGDTPTAKNTTVEKGATIDASATTSGNGGEVIVWADKTTKFAGSIKATGGKGGQQGQTNNGGFVETSGKDKLYSTGSVDASAPNGKAGEWLLDPTDVTIANGAGTDVSAGGTFNGVATIDANTIQTALNGGTSVTITTTSGGGDAGNISANAVTINKTLGGNASLTLKADKNISLTNSTITSTLGTLGFTLHADSDNNDVGYVYIQNSTITTNGGAFTAGGGLDPLTDYAWGNIASGQVIGVTIDASPISTGAGTITINGHGDNAGASDAYGISLINGTGRLLSTTGSINLTGVGGNTAGNSNRGINLWNSSQIQTDTGAITLTGTSGSAASSFNGGVVIWTGSSVVSTGTGGSVGAITLNGSSQGTGGINFGTVIESNASVTSVDGNIAITGTGVAGTGNKLYGVLVDGGGNTIRSTGNGNLTITGTAGAGTLDNVGVQVMDAGSLLSVANGNMSITGTGGNGSGATNHGIAVLTGATLQSTGATPGTITLNGTAGNSTGGGADNYGVYVSGSGKITGAGGTVSVTGTGGSSTGDGNNGVHVSGATAEISNAGGGSLTVTGTGGGSGISASNMGVRVHSTGGTIKTTGGGSLSVSGTGGNANGSGDFQYGVYVQTDNGIQTTGGGAITINGTGGNNNGSGTSNHGVYAANSITGSGGAMNITGTGGTSTGNTNYGVYVNGATAVVGNSGTGAITVTGTAGGTGVSNNNNGVYVNSVGSAIRTSGSGGITITGQGGNATGSGGSNSGVIVKSANGIQTTGGGAITVTGTGGNNSGGSGTNNYGVYLPSGSIVGSGGTMSVTGTGGASNGNGNHGIYLQNAGAAISNSGAGGITVNGTGAGTGASSSNRGVTTNAVGGTITTSGSGNIIITGSAFNSTGGVRMDVANGLQTTGTGSISISTDSLVLGIANAINSVRDLTVAPQTSNAGLGIGTGAGTLALSDAVLGNLTWGAGYTLTLGSATTGAVDINSGYTFANPVIFRSGAGYDISLAGTLTSTYNTGTSVTLVSGDDFINSGTLSANAGTARWLVYSETPGQNTFGGLAADFIQFSCTYGSCTPGAANNGFLYSAAIPPSGGGAATPTPTPTTSPEPEPTPVAVTPEPEPVAPTLPVIDTPVTSAAPTTLADILADTSQPIPQFLLNALLPSTYVVPAGPVDGPVGYAATSYDFGAPTPGLGNDGNNVDVRHSEAQRSGYGGNDGKSYGQYIISPEMQALLNAE